jgi:hypothetical protein
LFFVFFLFFFLEQLRLHLIALSGKNKIHSTQA